MDVRYETQRRLDIAEDLGSQVNGIVRGMMLGGSMGYGQNFSVRESSDIDTVVVCDKDRVYDLIETSYFRGRVDPKVVDLFKKGDINLFWLTREINGVEVNVFTYETKGYEDFCLLRGPMKGYLEQENRPSETQNNYLFDGSLVEIRRDVVEFGDGFLYSKPALADGRFWGVCPRSDFLYGGYIVYEQDNFLSDMEKKVWEVTVKKLKEEHGPEVDLDKFNILNTHYPYQNDRTRFPISAVEAIKKRTIEELAKL